RARALGKLLERRLARLADLDLAQGERELVREWAGHVVGELRDGAVESEARLDADRHQVERVRELGADRVLALACLRGDHEVRCDEADPAERDRAEEDATRARDRAA